MATNPVNELVQHLCRTEFLREGDKLSDGQLLESFVRRREGVALEALVRRHGPMVWGVCRRVLANHHDAEDAFQATFLVLVRKAASIRSRELLANWLYGVAHQTARKARQTAAKRHARERQVTEMPEPNVGSPEPDPWPDLQPLLDEELSRLPDKYRVAIVLCDLQGKSRPEAARQLGLPEGTVGSRLARGRAMLAGRLARRGLVVSAATLAAVLPRQAVSASVPAALLATTINGAGLLAVGEAAAAGAISAQVSALTEGVLKTMFLAKLKIGTLLVLGAVCVGSAALVFERTAAGQQRPTRGDAASPKSPPPGGNDAKGHPDPGDRWRKAAQRPKLSDREKAAYEEIAKLHLLAIEGPPAVEMNFPTGRNDPTDVLYRMGLDVLPQLAEALDDDTPTRTATAFRPGPLRAGEQEQKRFWLVNEVVARLIVKLASRDFIIDKEQEPKFPPALRDLNLLDIRNLNAQPGKAADFKKVVLDWYAANRDKTLAERVIADVSDRWFRNRVDAVEWLGANKSEAGRRAIEKRLDALFVEARTTENTTMWYEMSLCGLTLGKIGDKASLPQVRAVCRFLTDDDRWATGGSGPPPSRHFEAFHGLAMLGRKDEALRGLKAVYENRKDRLPQTEMIPELLDRASGW